MIISEIVSLDIPFNCADAGTIGSLTDETFRLHNLSVIIQYSLNEQNGSETYFPEVDFGVCFYRVRVYVYNSFMCLQFLMSRHFKMSVGIN